MRGGQRGPVGPLTSVGQVQGSVEQVQGSVEQKGRGGEGRWRRGGKCLNMLRRVS